MDTAFSEFVSTFIFPLSISFSAQQGAQWGKYMYILLSQEAQDFEVHNILLNLLLGARTFVYQKTLLFQHC